MKQARAFLLRVDWASGESGFKSRLQLLQEKAFNLVYFQDLCNLTGIINYAHLAEHL